MLYALYLIPQYLTCCQHLPLDSLVAREHLFPTFVSAAHCELFADFAGMVSNSAMPCFLLGEDTWGLHTEQAV